MRLCRILVTILHIPIDKASRKKRIRGANNGIKINVPVRFETEEKLLDAYLVCYLKFLLEYLCTHALYKI